MQNMRSENPHEQHINAHSCSHSCWESYGVPVISCPSGILWQGMTLCRGFVSGCAGALAVSCNMSLFIA